MIDLQFIFSINEFLSLQWVCFLFSIKDQRFYLMEGIAPIPWSGNTQAVPAAAEKGMSVRLDQVIPLSVEHHSSWYNVEGLSG